MYYCIEMLLASREKPLAMYDLIAPLYMALIAPEKIVFLSQEWTIIWSKCPGRGNPTFHCEDKCLSRLTG